MLSHLMSLWQIILKITHKKWFLWQLTVISQKKTLLQNINGRNPFDSFMLFEASFQTLQGHQGF